MYTVAWLITIALIWHQGTGSYPPLLQGLQRNMRKTLNHVPRNKPYFAYASQAYCEQVGLKRHDGAKRGLIQYW